MFGLSTSPADAVNKDTILKEMHFPYPEAGKCVIDTEKMISPNADELLKGARAYDLEALGNIYDLYSPGIYRYAVRLLGDDSLAEDYADTAR